MQKPKNRILSALLALAMILTMLPATVFAEGETEIFAGWSLTLGENIGVNFYLAEEAASYTVNTTVAGNAAEHTAATKDGCYVVTVNVAAAQMTDTIGLTVLNGETEVHSGSYTVRQYAETILTGEYDDEVKEMVKEMLNYGAAAQTYFAYNADPLANAGYEIETGATVPTEVPEITVEDNLTGIGLYGMSLIFQSKTAVRFYFTVSGDISTYTFKVGENAYTPVEKDGLYYVEVGNINPLDLDKEITVSVNDGALSVSYSPLNYIVRKYNSDSSSTELKALVQAMYGYHLEALDYQEYLKITQLGYLGAHSDTAPWVVSDTVTYFKTSLNVSVPTDGDYSPLSEDAIKLVRDGVTYNVAIVGANTLVLESGNAQCLIKLAAESISGDLLPIQANDYLIIEGRFKYWAGDVVQINRTYVYYDGTNVEVSTTEPVVPTSYDLGSLTAHPDSNNNWTTGGVYMAHAESDAPHGDGDWAFEYYPLSTGAIKRIRDGETIDVAIVGRGTLVKYSATEMYMNINSWTMGENQPAQDGDVYVIDGSFYNEATKATINISKSYIYFNGSDAEFSTEMPTLPTTVEGGVMQTHANGMSGNGIYFKMDANDAPYDGWSIEYAQTSVDNIKLIRDGETISIGIVDRPLLIKYSDTEYYLKLEGWTIGDYGLDKTSPITTDDVLIIEGGFYHAASKVTLNVTKSYVYYDGSAWVCSATEPVFTTEVDCGTMSEHEDGSASDIYFAMSDNTVPVDEELAYAYAGTVQLVSGGATSSVNANSYKLGEGYYYLELNGVTLADGDYLIVEGAFANSDNGYILNITKTYILVDGDALVYSTTEPVLESEYAVTGLTNHSNGWGTGGIYITNTAHEATYNSDWSVEYKPVSADAIKLVRDGVTTSVGISESGTLVVYSATEMYLKTAAWTISGSVLPFVDGDQIIVEGKFKHEASGNILVVEKTVICVNGSDLIFNPIFAGNLSDHSNGAGGDGVYATMAANSAEYVTDWSTEFAPLTADAYSVIRDGVETNIGITGRGTLVKHGETDYYLKTSGWCLDTFAATTSDILVIDGFWKSTANETILKIETTYLYYDGSAWVFSTKLPTTVYAGVMQTHGSGMWGNGISFTMDANAAPYNSDWSLEYTQTSVDNIKLIRDGETVSIGIVDRPLIIKISDDEYYLKLEAWTIGDYGLNSTSPITTDDVIIVEGNFEYAADNVTLNISKSYVYYDGSAWVCSAEAPVQKNVVDVTGLGSHSNGWSTGGIYLTNDTHGAPFNSDWSVEYTPVSEDVVKLVRGGETSNVAIVGQGTIVMYSQSEMYFKTEAWTISGSKLPLVSGDMLIIEGQFYNAANDAYIDIEKTYITVNEDGSIAIISESSKYINAGAMSAYSSNWFGDGIYFAMGSNAAPAAEDWTVRYMPKATSNVKLLRNGETFNIANTGAETIVKIADGWYWLSLESWWWSTYAPIVDGDILVIEGEFTNASNGYTLNIDKTYITFVSKENDDVVFSTASDTEFGEVLLPTSNDTLNIGMWNGSYHVFEDKQLQELQAAGITKIMGIDTQWIGTTDVNAWLDRVYSYGISVIFDLRSWDGTTVPDYASHPGVIGFLMYDEPCATDFDTLADLKAKFDAVMPEGTLFYVNLFPECAGDASLVGVDNTLIGNTDYDQYYVSQFLAKLDIEVLSWDNYSLLEGSGIRTDYFHNFEVMASKNVPLWYTMLSAGHSTTTTSYATPTAEELRWQMAVAMTYGVQNIDHYVYVSHESDYSCMVEYDTWEPTDLYYDILTVDNEYLAWDNIFMAYSWQGVAGVKAGSSSTMLDMLENNIDLTANGLASVSTSQDLLVGVFDYNGDKAYMVTNAGSAGSSTVGDGKDLTMTDATVTLTLADGDYKCVAVIDQGVITYVAVNADNTVSIPVSAYEGVFVIPVLN